MKIRDRFTKLEKAQVLPIVVVALVVLIAFAALIVDGGAIILNRREAQAAADAGAMAGAHELCYATGADPLVVAENYANMNGAATVNAQMIDGLVDVTTSVENDSFFAKIFDQNTLVAKAEAAAGCFAPLGNYLLPIAWSCRPTYVDEAPFDPGLDCKMMALEWTGFLERLVNGTVSSLEIPGNTGDYVMEYGDNSESIVELYTRKPPRQLYLVMDKIAVNQETYCKEDLDPMDPAYLTAITCDLDGDGKNDIEGGGNRGWLDLNNAGGGASDLVDWIVNGLDFPISPHTWRSGQTGTVTSVFETIKDYRVGDVVLIPVFNTICDDNDPLNNPACMADAHAFPFEPEPPTGDIDEPGQAPKFHVISFEPFYIACVHTFSFDSCPGFDLAQEMNPDPDLPHKSLIPDNTASVEGYFLTNVDVALNLEDPCNVNLGNCVVTLTK